MNLHPVVVFTALHVIFFSVTLPASYSNREVPVNTAASSVSDVSVYSVPRYDILPPECSST